MDDLISRAAAITEVEQWAEHGYDVIHWTGIKAMLEVQPAADAVPVVHGRWIDENPDDFLDPRIKCSVCAWVGTPLIRWRYCPRCGAKMDEVERQ